MPREVVIDGSVQAFAAAVVAAIAMASDQDEITWLVRSGERIAAIVPAEAAKTYERYSKSALHGRAVPGITCGLCGHPGRHHRIPPGMGGARVTPDDLPELDCPRCPDGKCRA